MRGSSLSLPHKSIYPYTPLFLCVRERARARARAHLCVCLYVCVRLLCVTAYQRGICTAEQSILFSPSLSCCSQMSGLS